MKFCDVVSRSVRTGYASVRLGLAGSAMAAVDPPLTIVQIFLVSRSGRTRHASVRLGLAGWAMAAVDPPLTTVQIFLEIDPTKKRATAPSKMLETTCSNQPLGHAKKKKQYFLA